MGKAECLCSKELSKTIYKESTFSATSINFNKHSKGANLLILDIILGVFKDNPGSMETIYQAVVKEHTSTSLKG